MGKNEPTGISKILDTLKASGELGQQLEQAQIWEQWPAIAGVDLMHHGQPRAVKNNVLYIEVDSAVWMHKFSYFKADILSKIGEVFGKLMIEDLHFILSEELGGSTPQDSV
jgi:predicted nucleic acid-binding Zn ribbon protein